MTTNETIALQKVLIESLWREIVIARDRATAAKHKASAAVQEATFAEERLSILMRQLVHAGAAPDTWKDSPL